MTSKEHQAVKRSHEEAEELYRLTLSFLFLYFHSKARVITICRNEDQEELKVKTGRISMKVQKYFADTGE